MRRLSTDFKQTLASGNFQYLVNAEITLSSGDVLELTNEHIWNGGFIIEDAISDDNDFTALGSVIIGSAELLINNIDGTFSEYDFTNADVIMRLKISPNALDEYVTFGTYTVDDADYNGATIHLYMLDYLAQLDRPYSLNASGPNELHYPATLLQIASNACLCCGLELDTYTFPNYTYTVQSRPVDESITFREVLSWVATIAGCYVKADNEGRVEIKEFNTTALEAYKGGNLTFQPWNNEVVLDGGTFNPWNVGSVVDDGTFDDETRNNVAFVSSLYSQNIAVDDVVITGISVIVKDESNSATTNLKYYTSGRTGYVIEVANNPFITTTTGQQIANYLGSALIGMQFRKMTITHSTDPSIEVGDVAVVVDRKQNSYVTLVTRVRFSADAPQTLICGASTPARNSATRYSAQTKSYVESRKLLKQEMTEREAAIRDLANAIASSSGLYTTSQPSSSGTIFYMHDKQNLADSKIVWKMTAEAWAVTTDYNGASTTWNAGVTVNGTVIANILSAAGVNADWITSGSLKLQGAYGSSGATALIANDTDLDINILLVNQAGLIARGIPICAIRKYAYSDGHHSYTKLENGELSIGFTTNPSNLSGSYTTQLGYIALMTSSAGYHSIAFHTNNNNDEIFIGPFAGGLQVYNNAVAHRDNYFNVYPNIIGNTQAFFRDLYCYSLYCSPSSKSCYIETDDYGTRLQYTYETASPYFGDIGDAETDENGICYVQIDDIMRETTSEDTHYSVFLQKEGPGDIWVDTKATDYFVVKGTPNLRFSWEIKMRQKEGSYKRLELLPETSPDDIDYASEAEQVYEEYLSEMEA